MKTILFSPVGGTDPIATSNCRDGSMLHICRCYRPDQVYLYMSGEILSFQEQDRRYTWCLDRLSERIGQKIEYILEKRPEMERVYDFDLFYQEFRDIIFRIQGQMEPGDRLLLNVSSGTPAMKSALLVLKTLVEFPCTAIQVTTPTKTMNSHEGHEEHKDYALEELWELDEDNQDGFENRCIEVKCPTLQHIQQENNIRRLLEKYDYAAAYELALGLPKEMTENYLGLLQMASRRILLDFSGVDKILLQDKRFALPVRDSGWRKQFEFALTLQVKLKQEEYGDFIRAITPLLWDLYERILAKYTDVRLKQYCELTKEKAWRWKQYGLEGTEILEALEEKLDEENSVRRFRYGDVSSYHLYKLIWHYAQDRQVAELVKDLRNVESKVRNIAAHQIVSITDDVIQQKTGFTGDQIMKKIRKAVVCAGLDVRADYWNSYDVMNSAIMRAMSKTQ